MIVRVDGGQPSSQIGRHRDRTVGDAESPWLYVVVVGGQRRVTNEFPLGRGQQRIEAVAVAPGVTDGGVVITGLLSVDDQRSAAPNDGDGADACESSKESFAPRGAFHVRDPGWPGLMRGLGGFEIAPVGVWLDANSCRMPMEERHAAVDSEFTYPTVFQTTAGPHARDGASC